MSTQPCKACRAPVHWAQNVKTKKPAPIDAPIDPNGNVIIYRKGGERRKVYRVLSGDALEHARKEGIPLHTNHFQTCPEAGKFKPKKAKPNQQCDCEECFGACPNLTEELTAAKKSCLLCRNDVHEFRDDQKEQ